jgi:hypothetical protein
MMRLCLMDLFLPCRAFEIQERVNSETSYSYPPKDNSVIQLRLKYTSFDKNKEEEVILISLRSRRSKTPF